MPNTLPFDQNQILQYVDIGLIVAFAAFFVFILLAFIRGLFRGWKHGTYRVVFLGVLTIVLVALMPIWIDILGKVNLASWIASPQHVEMRGKSFELQIGTVFETTRNFFEGFLKYILEVRMSPVAISNYAIALAGSVIRLALVVAIAVIVESLGSLLCWILWHLLFKRFIPKPRRKPTLRWLSGLEDALVWIGLTAMAVVPVSGVLNAIHNNGEIPPDEQNDTLAFVQRVIDTYDKSIFNQAFFAWTKGNGKDTFDTQLASFIAANSYTYNDPESGAQQVIEANIVKEIRIIAHVEGALVNWMVGPTPSEGTVSSLFHASLLMGQTLFSLVEDGAEPLLNGVVPLTFDIARNIDEIQSEVLNQKLSFATPKAKKSAYAKIAQTDYVSVIDDLFQGDYAVAAYDSSLPYSTSYLPLVQKEIESSPASRELVNSLVSGYVLGQAQTNPLWEEEGKDGYSMLDMLPHHEDGELDEEAIAHIDWWREANVLYDVQKRFHAMMPKQAENSEDSMMSRLLDSFTAAFADDPYGLIELLVGRRDDKGEPIADSHGNNQGALCLFDSDLLAALSPYALAIGGSYLRDEVLTDPEDAGASDDIDALLAQFEFTTSADMRVKLRREFGAILDVTGKAVAHQSGAGARLVRDYKNHPGFTVAEDGSLVRLDPNLCLALTDGVKCLDNSRFFNSLAPVVGEHFARPLTGEEQTLGKLGIRNIDLRCGGLGNEIANLLSLGVNCEDLVRVAGALLSNRSESGLSATSLINGVIANETEEAGHQLTHFLDIITGSKVLNPLPREGKPFVKNENIAGLLNYLFSNIGQGSEVSISVEDLNLEMESQWEGKTIKPNQDGRYGENYYIAACLVTLVNTKILDNMDSLSGGDTQTLMRFLATLDVKSLFNSIGDSAVMRIVSSALLDSFLLDGLVNSDKKMDLKQIGVSYKNLLTSEDWQREGDSMQALFDLVLHGLDFSQLDFTNPMVIDMARELASSKIFYNPVQDESGDFVLDGDGNVVTDYVFPQFFADKLLHSLTTADNLKLFLDNPYLVPNEFPDSTGTMQANTKTLREIVNSSGIDWNSKSSFEQKKILCSVFYEAVTTLTEPEQWLGEYDGKGTLIQQGEFDYVQEALRAIQAAGGMELFNTIYLESIPGLTVALRNCAKSQILSSVMLPNAVEIALTSDGIPKEIRDSNVNTGYFYRVGEQLLVYRNSGETEAYNELYAARDEQIDLIITLVNVCLADPTIRQDAALSITFGNIDVNGFMRPLLQSAHNSKVLHPGVGDTYKRILSSDLYDTDEWDVPEITAFENLIVAFMQKSAVYVDAGGAIIDDSNNVPVKGTNKKLSEIVNGVADWEAEIENICELIELLQSSSFLNGIGDIDLSPLSHLDTYFAKRHAKEELNAFFVCISDSEIFYRCLPGKLEKTIQDAMAGMTIANINKDIACADFFYTSIDGGNDFTPYSRDEIHSLVDAFEGIASCLDIKLSDLSTINAEPLSQALLKLGSSKIFNSNTEKSNTQFAAVPYRQGMTCYQEMVVDMLMVDALEEYYFLSASPKDAYHVGETHYSDAKSKMAYSVRESFPAIGATYQGQPVTPASFEIIAGPTVNGWRDCIECLKRPYFTDFIKGTAKFEDLTEDSVSVMLHALNDCTVYRDCVPNALYKSLVTDNTVSVDGVNFSAADVYFSYYMQENGAFKVTWNSAKPDFNMPFYEPEIDQLSMLIPLLRDNASKFQNVKLKGEGAIDATLLRAILFDVHDSYIFHEAEAVATHGNENTIFRQLINVFLNKSKIYDKSLVGPEGNKVIAETDMSLRDVVLSVAEPAWAPEIENTYELLCTIQNSNYFVDSSGNFDLSGLSDPKTFFSNPAAEAELRSLLTHVNGGKLYYRCLPAQMDKAMKDSFNGSSDLLLRIQDDLSCSDYYHMAYVRSDAKRDIQAYPQGEVSDLVSLFKKVASFTGIDLSDLSTIETEDLRDAMGIMGQMEIYNSNVTKSVSVFVTPETISRKGMTAHQAMLCDVLLVDSLKDFYFLNESPKDTANVSESHYTDANSKMSYSVKGKTVVLSPMYASASLREAAQQGYRDLAMPYFNEWKGCLDQLSDPRFTNLINGSADMDSIQGDDLEILLKSMNDCAYYRDIVPNSLYDTLITKKAAGVDGVDFAKSDIFFSYYMHNGHGEFSSNEYRVDNPNFEMKFNEDEIEHISALYSEIKTNKDTLSNLKLKDLQAGMLRGILGDLHDSYVLNLASVLHRPTDPDACDRYDIENSGHFNFGNLSVFEQFIYKIMKDTTLYDFAYHARRDYLTAVAYPDVAANLLAEYKMRDSIIALGSGIDANIKWLHEIDALTTDEGDHDGSDANPYVGIIEAGQQAGIFANDSSEMGMGYDVIEKVSPKKIKMLFYAFNESELLRDVVPNSVVDVLGAGGSDQGIGLSKYSSINRSIALSGEHAFDATNALAYPYLYSGSAFKAPVSLAVSLANNPADHYQVMMDGQDVTRLVPASYSAGVATFYVGGLPKAFTLSLNDSYVFGSDVTAKIDFSDFYLTKESFRTKAIPSLGLMLSSAYRGEGKNYFDFGGGSELTSFTSETTPVSDYRHSTYGLLHLFGESGFYSAPLSVGVDGMPHYDPDSSVFTAGSYAIYSALNFDIEAPVDLPNLDVGGDTLVFPTKTTISIGDRIGKGTTKVSHMAKLQQIFGLMNGETANYVREAQWFDQYAAHAGTFDLFNSFHTKALNENEYGEGAKVDINDPVKRTLLHTYIDKIFAQTPVTMDSMRTLLDSSRVSYDIDVPNDPADLWHFDTLVESVDTPVATLFGNEVLASILHEYEQNSADYIDLNVNAPTAKEANKRSTRIGNPLKPVSDEEASLRDDYYASDFALIRPDFMSEAKAGLTAMEILNKASLAGEYGNLANAFKALAVGNASRLNHLVYLASLYQKFLPSVLGGEHNIFQYNLGTMVRTDFAYIERAEDPSKNYNNEVDPNTKFSFTAIANILEAMA